MHLIAARGEEILSNNWRDIKPDLLMGKVVDVQSLKLGVVILNERFVPKLAQLVEGIIVKHSIIKFDCLVIASLLKRLFSLDKLLNHLFFVRFSQLLGLFGVINLLLTNPKSAPFLLSLWLFLLLAFKGSF